MQHSSQQSAFANDQQQVQNQADRNQADHQIEDAAPKKYYVTAKEFSAKYNDKDEIYNFLACEVCVYLPHSDHITIWFLQEIMNGKKKKIFNEQVRNIHVPQ